MKEKFEYFLNAVHYCIFLSQLRLNAFFDKYVGLPFARMLEFFMSEKGKQRFRLNQQRSKKELDDFFCSKEAGFCIGLAHHFFGFFVSSYWGLLSFIILSILCLIFGPKAIVGDTFVFIVIVGIPIIIGYIPVYRAVFTDDRYLDYFKQFEKEDEEWHKRWKRRTWLFFIFSVVASLLGIGLLVAMLVFLEMKGYS